MIFDSYGKCKEMVQALCRADPASAVYLMEQTAYERQCLVMILLSWHRAKEPKTTLGDLGKMLQSQSKKALLRKFVQPYPVGLDNVLGKLGGRVLAEERYYEIIELLWEPNAAKVLRHLKKIRPFTIEMLRTLPPAFRISSIVGSIHRGEALQELRYAISVVRAHLPVLTEQAIVRSLERCVEPGMVTGSRRAGWRKKHPPDRLDVSEWLERRLRKAKLPQPPWNGTDKLSPLCNTIDILKTAKEFKNCLASEIGKAVGQDRYFYVWRGNDKAVAALDRDPLIGWTVGDIQGPGNNPVKAETRQKILNLFESAGIHNFPDYYPNW